MKNVNTVENQNAHIFLVMPLINNSEEKMRQFKKPRMCFEFNYRLNNGVYLLKGTPSPCIPATATHLKQ